MAEVKFKRTTNINNVEVDDGTFLVDYQNQKAYIDVNNERIPFAGATIVNTTHNESNIETYSTNYINTEIENINTEIGNIGKKLWEGTFTSGSITVSGINNYSVIVVMLDAGTYGVACIGTKTYGLGGVGSYGSYSSSIYNYRLGYNSTTEEFTISNTDKGGSDGTQNIPIKAIYGLF